VFVETLIKELIIRLQ